METDRLSSAWAARASAGAIAALAVLRAAPSIEVQAGRADLWLRGSTLDDSLRNVLLGLPLAERYSVDDAGRLVPWGRIVPTGKLPAGAWLPLRTWCELALPSSAWPGQTPASVQLSLVRTGSERAAGALLVAWEDWARYAETAPRVRLDGLAFVANRARQAIVRGESPPPLPGMRLVDLAGILVPAGMAWQPAIDADAARGVFGLADGECALWLETDAWERIAADAWSKATRSAVRLTAREGDLG